MTIFVNKKPDFIGLVKKYSVISIILAVLGLGIGGLFIAAPLASTAVIIWVALGLLALGGLVAILKFIFPGKGNERSAAGFVLGLLVVALFVVLLLCALTTAPQEDVGGFAVFTGYLIRFFSIFFGISVLIYAIWSLCSIGSVPSGTKGWVIATDIINIVLGCLMIAFPFIYSMVAGIITGVYIVIISIVAIVYAIKALSAAHKIKKESK